MSPTKNFFRISNLEKNGNLSKRLFWKLSQFTALQDETGLLSQRIKIYSNTIDYIKASQAVDNPLTARQFAFGLYFLLAPTFVFFFFLKLFYLFPNPFYCFFVDVESRLEFFLISGDFSLVEGRRPRTHCRTKKGRIC